MSRQQTVTTVVAVDSSSSGTIMQGVGEGAEVVQQSEVVSEVG